MLMLFRSARPGTAGELKEPEDRVPVLAGSVEELARASRLVVQLPGQESSVVVAATKRGLFAYDGTCPLVGGSLAEGEIAGATITCPWHGRRYSLKSGRCVSTPGQARLRRWHAWTDRGQVWIGEEAT
jgi:nitrite reductase/ring-hydroxylating ferredoxin subunit